MNRVTRRLPIRPQTSVLRTFAPLSLAALVAVGGVAMSYYVTRSDSPRPFSTAQNIAKAKAPLPTDLSGLIPPSKIQDIAKNMGGSNVNEMTLESHGGLLIYKAELNDGKTLGFDATTGSAVSLGNEEKEDAVKTDNEPTQETSTVLMSRISLEDAATLSQAAFPKNQITEIKLKPQNGKPVIAVLFEHDAMVEIDAETGDVFRVSTPKGAVAEAPSISTEPSATDPAVNPPTNQEIQTDNEKNQPDDRSRGTVNDDETELRSPQSEKSEKADTSVIQIDGLLELKDGAYTITKNGTTYRIEAKEDLERFIGEYVRIKGQSGDDQSIHATEIEPSRDHSDSERD